MGGGGGGGLYPRRPITGCVLCLQVNRPVTGGSYKWGEGGLLPNVMFCFQGNEPVTGGTYKWGEGGLYPGGLITRCNVLFTGKWTCNWGNL